MTLVDVAAVADVPADGTTTVEVDGRPVCLVHASGKIFAIHNTCTHALERMEGGWIEGGTIECPRHGARFDCATGAALSPPATKPLPVFDVTIRDGRILLDPTPSYPHPLLERNENGAARG